MKARQSPPRALRLGQAPPSPDGPGFRPFEAYEGTLTCLGIPKRERLREVNAAVASVPWRVQVATHYDPVAMVIGAQIIGDRCVFVASAYLALDDADALILATELPEFRAPDAEELAKRMRGTSIGTGMRIQTADPPRERPAADRYPLLDLAGHQDERVAAVR